MQRIDVECEGVLWAVQFEVTEVDDITCEVTAKCRGQEVRCRVHASMPEAAIDVATNGVARLAADAQLGAD